MSESEFASEGSQAADEEYDHIHAHPDDEPYAATSAGGQASQEPEAANPSEDGEGENAR